MDIVYNKKPMAMALILFLWTAGHGERAQASIEIYAHGQKYDSLQEYISAKKSAAVLSHKGLSPKELQELYFLGIESSIVEALQDFNERANGPKAGDQSVSLKQLPQYIRQAIAGSKNAKLVISQPGKLRILSLSSKSLDY